MVRVCWRHGLQSCIRSPLPVGWVGYLLCQSSSVRRRHSGVVAAVCVVFKGLQLCQLSIRCSCAVFMAFILNLHWRITCITISIHMMVMNVFKPWWRSHALVRVMLVSLQLLLFVWRKQLLMGLGARDWRSSISLLRYFLLVLNWLWFVTVLAVACISSYRRGRCETMLNVCSHWVLLNGKEGRRCVGMRLVIMLCRGGVAYSGLRLHGYALAYRWWVPRLTRRRAVRYVLLVALLLLSVWWRLIRTDNFFGVNLQRTK